MDFLTSAASEGKLLLHPPPNGLGAAAIFKNMVNQVWKKDWLVYSKEPFAGPEKVLDYLGRYTHRVAISNHRILSVEDGKVTFKYRNRKKGNVEEPAVLEASEFIRLFLLHILPSGFMKIRSYGFLANRYKKENLRLCRSLLGASMDTEEKEEKPPWNVW